MQRAKISGLPFVLAGSVTFACGVNLRNDEQEKPAVAFGQAPLLLDVQLTPAGVAASRKPRGPGTVRSRGILHLGLVKRRCHTAPRSAPSGPAWSADHRAAAYSTSLS